MSGYLDESTATLSRNAILFDGETLEQRAELLHLDTELLGRLLQLPTDSSDQDGDKLDAVL